MISLKNKRYGCAWWCTPGVLERIRQEDHQFEASLGYIACSRLAWLYSKTLS
jgi:hypothetical protein